MKLCPEVRSDSITAPFQKPKREHEAIQKSVDCENYTRLAMMDATVPELPVSWQKALKATG
ncbi:MAG: hypothetical protein OHK0029_26930 [Armatimonadaceae bacterium]